MIKPPNLLIKVNKTGKVIILIITIVQFTMDVELTYELLHSSTFKYWRSISQQLSPSVLNLIKPSNLLIKINETGKVIILIITIFQFTMVVESR